MGLKDLELRAKSLINDVEFFELKLLVLELVCEFKGFLFEIVFSKLVLLIELQVFGGELVNC